MVKHKKQQQTLAPQIGGQGLPPGNEPALGGNLRQVPCERCGVALVVDMFGERVCTKCYPPRHIAVTRHPLPDDPPWLNPGKWVPAIFIARARAGLHPFGQKLLKGNEDMAKRCANCLFRYTAHSGHSKTHYGCALIKKTAGPATDLRTGWPACTEWQERGDDRDWKAIRARRDLALAERNKPNGEINTD